jgi:hypothetical protein
MASTATKRVSGPVGSSATKRISAIAAVSATRRVPVVSDQAAVAASLGANCWVGWGNSWGHAWFGANVGSAAVEGRPAVQATPRVGANASTHQTNRIHHLLLLEGDMQDDGDDYLLLEGDMQSGDDVLSLQGDMATANNTATRRVPEAVT